MKTVTTFIFVLCLGLMSFAQTSDNTVTQKKPVGRSYCVQTINNDINNSAVPFQEFLRKEIELSQEGQPKYDLDMGKGTITYTYHRSIVNNYNNDRSEAYKVYVEYHVSDRENNLYVDKMNIWGNYTDVATIFILYYPTTLNVEELKEGGSEITSYYIADKAVFSWEENDGELLGRITIRENEKE